MKTRLYSGLAPLIFCCAFCWPQSLYGSGQPALAEGARPNGAEGECAPGLFLRGNFNPPAARHNEAPAAGSKGAPLPALDDVWRKEALKALDFSRRANGPAAPPARQFVALLENLASKSAFSDLRRESALFEALEAAGISLMLGFSKRDLTAIIQSYVKMQVTPGGKFIRRWREAAAKKRREFSSVDRYGLYHLFRDLNIPPETARAAGPAARQEDAAKNGKPHGLSKGLSKINGSQTGGAGIEIQFPLAAD